jgi:hypothetical protein
MPAGWTSGPSRQAVAGAAAEKRPRGAHDRPQVRRAVERPAPDPDHGADQRAASVHRRVGRDKLAVQLRRVREADARADAEGTRVPGRWRGDLITTDDRPREFLQLSDGSYVRVTSTGDGELMPAGEPVKPQRARGGSASTAVAFSSHVVADAPGCGLCTWSPRDGRWALKFVNQACVLHRDDQVEHG